MCGAIRMCSWWRGREVGKKEESKTERKKEGGKKQEGIFFFSSSYFSFTWIARILGNVSGNSILFSKENRVLCGITQLIQTCPGMETFSAM